MGIDARMRPRIWTDERDEALRRMRAAGASASTIATELSALFGASITRDAVVGRVAKLRAAGEVLPAPMPPPKRAPEPSLVSAVVKRTPCPPVAPEDPGRAHAKGLFEIRNGVCKFPINAEGEPWLFCGAESLPSRPYCAWHHRIAYDPLPVRRVAA